MIYLLYLIIIYLLFTQAIFLFNWFTFSPLRVRGDGPKPTVSVLIPARNEALNIERCVRSVMQQQYENLELVVLDDESTDGTTEILQDLRQQYPEKLSVINGKNKPANWLGKSWACHQLQQAAQGETLFFIDADVWLEPQAVGRAVATMNHEALHFLTVWPMQQVQTFWEKTIIPLIYFGLFTLLPSPWVYKLPAILSQSLKEKLAPVVAAACGQCLVFSRSCYNAIGGHQAVKNDIVEDVALAKNVRRHGFTMHMHHGRQTVHCRMYRSHGQIWLGLRKNFLALFGDSIPAFLSLAVVNFGVYVLPLLLFGLSLFNGSPTILLLSGITLAVAFIQRLMLAHWYDFDYRYALLHPLGILWLHALGIKVLYDHLIGQRAEWKSRSTEQPQ